MCDRCLHRTPSIYKRESATGHELPGGLLFSIAEPLDERALGSYMKNVETSERGLVFGPAGLDDVFAFPLHCGAARRFFAAREVSTAHAYVQV